MNLRPLFHVTFARHLERIAARGLEPSSGGGGWGGGYAGYSKGYVHLTTGEGVPFWYSKYEAIAESQSDNVLDDQMVPVVLRIDPTGLILVVDEEGSRDAPGLDSAVRTMQAITPPRLELFDGEDWVPITYRDDLDIEDALDPEEDEDSGDTLYWFKPDYDNPLIPEDDDVLYAEAAEIEE